MRITVISAEDIGPEIRQQWQTIQASNPILTSPYFCIEYTEIVSNVRKDISIGVIENAKGTIGFFPFQKRKGNIAEPVGGKISDYQGLIVSPGENLSIESLMNGCHLQVWYFDHLLADQNTFKRYHRRMAVSPIIDISNGFNNYLEKRKKFGSRYIVNLQRKTRKFEREIGPLRLELYSDNSSAFRQVIEWKRAQCIRTGHPDFLGWRWTTDILEKIWHTHTEMFAGMLSVLYCDDHIVAAHFGMRSSMTFHWWFPTYNIRYSKYSPGGILLLKLIEALTCEGINCIDLGKGDDFYKPSFATGEIQLAEGCIWLPSANGFYQKARYETELFLRYSPLLKPLKTVRDKIRGLGEKK